jgi:2-polyprenyl-3-methyl-5-hydroxy-6-metoxy-1,4-benzoquinol methylase
MQRFAFGRNWQRFFDHELMNEPQGGEAGLLHVEAATKALAEMLPNLAGRRFLDIGSGSGLSSLAAQRLGAEVYSFDYDAESVQCTHQMKSVYGRETPMWTIEQGSALDRDYLRRLGTFDVVYSWGVLHHTGNLEQALVNVIALIRPGGTLFISIYNDQGWRSRYWQAVKRAYNRSAVERALVTLLHLPLLGSRFAVRALTGRLNLGRGMSLWTDYIDWLGGYPFEVASFDAIKSFYEARGFALRASKRATSGCNEFLFERVH